jgi:hypothetical protein
LHGGIADSFPWNGRHLTGIQLSESARDFNEPFGGDGGVVVGYRW